MKPTAQNAGIVHKKAGFLKTFKKNLPLTLMALPALIIMFLFRYLPMAGLLLAFKRFSVRKGIFGSDWVWFDNFEFLFKTSDAWIITRNTICYLDEFAGQENPFYISVHYTAPHDPWDEDQHPAEFYDLYRDCAFTATPDEPLHPNRIPTAPGGTGEERKRLLRGYYAAVSAMDAGVGRLLDKLEELGLAEDTLVVFTADNGMNMGHHGIWGKGNGTFPFNLFDTAVKVPFIARWPGHIPGGRVASSMCSHYDIIQTFNDLFELGADLPDDLPGHSFADVLLGGADTDNHVVILDEYGNSRMIRNREWKYIHRYPYGPHELYHLTADPGEKENLIDHPEYAAVRQELLDALQKWYYTYASPAVDGSREAVTGFGQMRRPGIYSEGKPVYADSPKYQK